MLTQRCRNDLFFCFVVVVVVVVCLFVCLFGGNVLCHAWKLKISAASAMVSKVRY